MSETDLQTLDRRLRAVERALTDGDRDDRSERTETARSAIDGPGYEERITELEARIEEIESSLRELESAMQAVRGYVGNVRSVNRNVEQRAALALSTAERIESRIADDRARERDQSTPERFRQQHESGSVRPEIGREQKNQSAPKESLQERKHERTLSRDEHPPESESSPQRQHRDWGLDDEKPPSTEEERSANDLPNSVLARIRKVL
jgi:chromosome segregation ATPase